MTVDVEAIRARLEAATPGPWEIDQVGDRDGDWGYGGVWPEEGEIIFGYYAARDDFDSDVWTVGKKEDREFIAHARSDVPALLALVDEQTDTIERWQNDYQELAQRLKEQIKQVESLKLEVQELSHGEDI